MNKSSSKNTIRMARGAISELFLDTYLDEADYIRLRDVLNESQLPIDQLDFIYYEEITPLLYGNLESTAGAWSGFDLDWLENEILKQSIIDKVPWLNNVRRYWVTRTTKNDWKKLKQMLKLK